MKYHVVQIRNRSGISLLLVFVVLIMTISPTFAQTTSDVSKRSTAGAAPAPCAQHVTHGALGREGGLMALRGLAEQADPVVDIVKGEAYVVKSVRTESGGVYVAYARADCLGREGGLLSP